MDQAEKQKQVGMIIEAAAIADKLLSEGGEIKS